MSLSLKELKEIESLSCVETMEAYGSLKKKLMLVFLFLLLQSNCLTDLRKVVVHLLMVMAYLAQVAALNDYANVVANVQDDDVIIRFQDDPNDVTVTDDLIEDVDCHEVKVPMETFCAVLLDDFQVLMLRTEDFQVQAQTRFHLKIMMR
jgi:hypothetical protein